MKIARSHRKRTHDTIVPLIDVVFFLLVFFMLIGRMDATAPFEVSPPDAVTGRDMPAGGATISVSADGVLAFEGTVTTQQDLASAIAARLSERPDLRLRVNAHKGADLRYVLPLVSQAEALGVRDVVLVVTPPESER